VHQQEFGYPPLPTGAACQKALFMSAVLVPASTCSVRTFEILLCCRHALWVPGLRRLASVSGANEVEIRAIEPSGTCSNFLGCYWPGVGKSLREISA
jgi:hypothetical protein